MKAFDFSLLSQEERELFKRLDSPAKIQDYLEQIPINFEKEGETCLSPRRVLQYNTAHCMEGALLAAAALWFHGEPPLLLDLMTTADDYSHVVTLFKKRGYWGALSKTNHAVLRYREPIYKTLRELVLSYFHEYFLQENGLKTLRWYSKPFDLSALDPSWIVDTDDVWHIDKALDKMPHFSLLDRHMIKNLRPADAIEIKAGDLTDW